MEKYKLDLQMFAFEAGITPGTPTVTPVNVTTQDSMDPTMKTIYGTSLLENARAEMIYEQFAVKQPTKGNKVETETTQHGDCTSISGRLEICKGS